MKAATLVAALVSSTTLVACSEPLEFPDWTIDVPEGTEVHEYAPVADEDRAGHSIELVEDLVIGERGDDMNYAFGTFPVQVDVDDDGNIYVLDPSATRVQAFDATGVYRFTIGNEGQGPGEFSRPQRLAVVSDELVVFDSRNMRLSRFALDGTHRGDSAFEPARSLMTLAGNPDGTLTARHLPRRASRDEEARVEIIRLDAEGRQLAAITGSAWPEGVAYVSQNEGRTSVMSFALTPQPDMAIVPGEAVYFGTLEEYQVLSFAPTGAIRWALRVAVQRRAFPESRKEWAMGILHSRYPNARESEIDWPELDYVLAGIEADGHGHLYVFQQTGESNDEARSVDVYSTDGERLFGGSMPPIDWQVAYGDYIYGAGRDASGEQQIVRYRLVEPFERS